DLTAGINSQSSFDLLAKYSLGGGLFEITAGSDSSEVSASAFFDDGQGRLDVPVLMTTDPLTGNITISAIVVETFHPLWAECSSTPDNPCPIFSDQSSIHLDMGGRGEVDASHTFTVTLTPSDPNLVLTSADGRTASSAPAPVPEPASWLLLGT